MAEVAHPTVRRHSTSSPLNPPVSVGAWSRTRLLLVMATLLSGALTLAGGLGYAAYTTLTPSRPASAAPTSPPTDMAPLTGGGAVTVTGGDSSRDSRARRDAIAAAAMLSVTAEDARRGAPSAVAPPSIRVPVSTADGAAGVPTGFPRTPAGAVGQLAAIQTTVLHAMSIEAANDVYEAWALPGGVGVADWEMTRNVQAFLVASGSGPVKAPTTVVVATPAAAQIKGTDGADWVLACVLLEVRASITAEAHIGYGSCERMQWTEDRWLIAPGAPPARAPSTWPGTDLAIQAGWRTWVHS